jgi:hypothetical protein
MEKKRRNKKESGRQQHESLRNPTADIGFLAKPKKF